MNPEAFPKSEIPEPVFDRDPALLELYWLAWRQAWNHVKECEGAPQSPYMDEAFDPKAVWIWDTCFMALYCKYASQVFPGVESLDNFYAPIHDGVGSPLKIHHVDNPPLFAWVEYEYAKLTGNIDRVRHVLCEKGYLQKHFAFFENQPPPRKFTHPAARMHNDLCLTESGFLWSGVASGMDNTPRGRGDDPHGIDGHERILWFDALSQQGMAAQYIAEMAGWVGDESLKHEMQECYESIKQLCNKVYWNHSDGIYYDVLKDDVNTHVKVKTPAAYWPLLAGFCSEEQADCLMRHAEDPNVFGGKVPFPTVSRDDIDYRATGHYWRGGVWLPTAYMAIKSLEKAGNFALADEHAFHLVEHMKRTFLEFEPHTIWECYHAEEPKPSTDKDDKTYVRPDFCGWSALGPISLFIENILGFREINGIEKHVQWEPPISGRVGIKNLRFGGITADLIREEDGTIKVNTDNPFTLTVSGQVFDICSGQQKLALE